MANQANIQLRHELRNSMHDLVTFMDDPVSTEEGLLQEYVWRDFERAASITAFYQFRNRSIGGLALNYDRNLGLILNFDLGGRTYMPIDYRTGKIEGIARALADDPLVLTQDPLRRQKLESRPTTNDYNLAIALAIEGRRYV